MNWFTVYFNTNSVNKVFALKYADGSFHCFARTSAIVLFNCIQQHQNGTFFLLDDKMRMKEMN